MTTFMHGIKKAFHDNGETEFLDWGFYNDYVLHKGNFFMTMATYLQKWQFDGRMCPRNWCFETVFRSELYVPSVDPPLHDTAIKHAQTPVCY